MKTIAFAAMLALAPAVAGAVTIEPHKIDSWSGVITSGQTLEVDLVPTENLDISFSVAATGDGTDISMVTWGYTLPTDGNFTVIELGPVDSAYGKPFDVTSASPFSFFFEAGNTTFPVGVTLSWSAIPAEGPAPVPLPAAGLLLAGALGITGLVRRKKA